VFKIFILIILLYLGDLFNFSDPFSCIVLRR